MRSVPIGVLRQPYIVRQVAATQAAITHNTPEGILSSQAVALMSNFAMWTDRPMSELSTFLGEEDPALRKFSTPWNGKVRRPNVGIKTAHAVCTLLETQTTLLGILRQVIDWAGDTDSVASIAWGIASARMHEPLPDFFEWGLETGRKYGVSFLKDLGHQLMEAHQ